MSRRIRRWGIRVWCFPRVSGDEPQEREMMTIVIEFSPRERG